jgi:hypothetical protein
MKGTPRRRGLRIAVLTLPVVIALSLKFFPWNDTPREPIPSSATPAAASEQHPDSASKRAFASAVSAPTATPPEPKATFPDTEAGRRLTAHWQVATTPRRTAAEADREYQQSIRELRKERIHGSLSHLFLQKEHDPTCEHVVSRVVPQALG